MGRGRQSFEKRQREKAKQEKQAAKRARREERTLARAEGDDDADAGLSEAELLEQFRVLNERHAAGELSAEDFEERKAELFEELGLETG